MDAKSMVKSFRVIDLRALLVAVGEETKGLKEELIRRTIRLIQNEKSEELLTKINDIYNSRYQRANRRTVSMNAANRTTPSPSPQDSDVKLMAFPFHQTLDTLIDITALKPSNQLKQQLHRFSFTLRKTHLKELVTNKTRFSGGSKVQVVIRICYTDSLGVADDLYPPDLRIVMNEKMVPLEIRVKNPGEEPRRPCPPINITSELNLSPGVNNPSQAGTIVWQGWKGGKCYSFAVYLVRVLSAEELLAKHSNSSLESVECCRLRIFKKMLTGQDCEVATTGMRVSLLCPLAKTRLRVPCRASTCSHLQCFDALAYLELNYRKPTWVCPVCDRPAPFNLLTIDGLLSSLLVTTEESVEEIEFLADGSWRTMKNQHKAHRSPPTDLSVSLTRQSKGEVIDLTLDSDEE